MAYSIFKVSSINSGLIQAQAVYIDPSMLDPQTGSLAPGVTNKFTFVKASSLDVTNLPLGLMEIRFNYKDKY